MPTSAYTAWLTVSVSILNTNTCFPFIFHPPLNNYFYQKLKRADCMDENLTWECGILSRDNLSHPPIQGDQHQCNTEKKTIFYKRSIAG
jgi:hypothetical protein